MNLTFTLPTYQNITLAGDTSFTAVNSYLGVNLANQTNLHNELVVRDDSSAYLYGDMMNQTMSPKGQSMLGAYAAFQNTFTATPYGQSSIDTTGQYIGNLASGDNIPYFVGASGSGEEHIGDRQFQHQRTFWPDLRC